METTFTMQLKQFAKDNGADLIGVADLKRWCSAPFNRTPQALMPDCTCAVVMGFHYLDSCVELGAQPDVRLPGPSVSNHIASEHGNYTAFKLCKFIEKNGYRALMVPATGWWNYRANDAAPRGFAADITHYYAACAAGLGEIAWNNLCVTPQFGPRQRWITVVTDAPLDIDPMYDGEKLCDGCKLCERHCPGQVFDKESKGTITVDFGEKSYTFKHKNLWRCAIGENFQLDSLMKRPDNCNEETIRKLCEDWASGKAENRYSWKMGQCLKWCMPRKRRYFDRSFTSSPRRRRDVAADYTKEGIEGAYKLLCDSAKRIGVSKVSAVRAEDFLKLGIDLTKYLPTAKSALAVFQYYPQNCEGDTLRQCMRNALWLAKILENEGGYDTLVESGIDPENVKKLFACGGYYNVHTIITDIPFDNFEKEIESIVPTGDMLTGEELKKRLFDTAMKNGAELFGVSSAERLDAAVKTLGALYESEEYFTVTEQGWGEKANRTIDMKGKPKNPKAVFENVKTKTTKDYIENAQSVIVIGLSMLNGSVKNVMKPPAYKGAHYAATVHKEMFYQNRETALSVCNELQRNGYKAYMTDDLANLSSISYSFLLPDIRANNLSAVCAGLGALAKNGLAVNEKYGQKVRYIAIVTDAKLPQDELKDAESLKCGSCDICIKKCPAAALSGSETVNIKIDGQTYKIARLNRLRCDWAMRYGLMKEAGPKCLGSLNDYPVPEKITPEILTQTVRESDRLQISNFAPIVEKCMLECPYNEAD